MDLVAIEKNLILAVYAVLIERPFKEVAHVAVPLFQQMDPQIKSIEEKKTAAKENSDDSSEHTENQPTA